SQEVLDPGAGRAELIPGRSTSRFPPAQPTSSFFPYERRWQQVGQDRSEIRVRRRAVRRMRPTGRTPSAWERGEDAADGVSGVGGLHDGADDRDACGTRGRYLRGVFRSHAADAHHGDVDGASDFREAPGSDSFAFHLGLRLRAEDRAARSEERRVGKEWRWRRAAYP